MSRVKSFQRIASQAKSGEYDAHGSIADADCVIGQDFGYRKTPEGIVLPGEANIALARYMVAANLYLLPKILQSQLDNALEQEVGLHAEYRIEKHRKEGKYLDTREVTVQAADIMRDNSWNRAVILGHPYHMPRLDSVAQKLAIETVAPDGIEAIWDAESEQHWTRSPEAWASRELRVIGLYAVKGWLTLE